MSSGGRNSTVTKPDAGAQLAFIFGDGEGGSRKLASDASAQSTPAVSKSAATPLAKKTAKAASMPSAADSLKEAERLIDEGLLLRYAGVQRRHKLQGLLNFKDHPKPVPPVRAIGELVPAFLKKELEGWAVSEEGFTYALLRPDAPAICRLVNARKNDLGSAQK
jgi:hypothetical protein